MSSCHQDNLASTTMWEPSRSTLSALHLSTVNMHSTSKGEPTRCTSCASWPHHLNMGTHTHIYVRTDYDQTTCYIRSVTFLGNFRIVEVAGCLDDVKRSWLTPMVIERRWPAYEMCYVCSMCLLLFCVGQKRWSEYKKIKVGNVGYCRGNVKKVLECTYAMTTRWW